MSLSNTFDKITEKERLEQVQVVQEYVQTLKKIALGRVNVYQVVEVTQKATAKLEAEGVPILELTTSSQDNASGSAQNSYSEDNFWKKMAEFAKSAGKEVVEKALILFYTLQQPNLPIKAKTIIYSALGYFILPLDIAPDFIPVVGFGDDVGALLAALAAVAIYITPEVKEAARQKMRDWFE
ncbi:MAG TPA: YkvA family protein [Oculatellaceae cyanobacterium]|jgi:uncharacterized membrane protein YkvA (DUF1232 family)